MEMEQQKGKDSEMAGSAPGMALGMVMFIIDNGPGCTTAVLFLPAHHLRRRGHYQSHLKVQRDWDLVMEQ